MSKTEIKVFPDIEFEGAWRVESLQPSGEIHIALFSGPESERLAHEYEAFRNGTHPAVKSENVVAPVVADSETVMVNLTDGGSLVIRPKELLWSFSKRWNSLNAKPKPAIQRLGARKGKE